MKTILFFILTLLLFKHHFIHFTKFTPSLFILHHLSDLLAPTV
jgi:hypothetical protein